MNNFRVERDSIGAFRVPADAYYGIFTERARQNFRISHSKMPIEIIRSLALIKKAAVMANVRLGKLAKKKGDAIIRAADEVIKGKYDDEFILDAFQAGAGTSSNMNVNEVIANRATEILGGRKGQYIVHPNDDVNMSQSSNDVFPAAIRITSYMLSLKLLREVHLLGEALKEKRAEFRGVKKVGRTHLQDAVNINVGDEFRGYEGVVMREHSHIKAAAGELLELNLGATAVGNGLNTPKGFKREIISAIRRMTGIKFREGRNLFELTQSHNSLLNFSSALRNLAVGIDKICNDMRLLSSGPLAGFNEILLPKVQPGSSIMPAKVNPSIPEAVNMACYRVIGNDTVVMMAANAGQLELNVMTPVIAFSLVESTRILENAIETLRKKAIAGLKVNEKRLKETASSNVMDYTRLAPKLGYSRVAELIKKKLKELK